METKETSVIITLAALNALAADALLALAQQLHAAVRYLASVCDGAKEKDERGFSASDTVWGRAIAVVAPELWTAEDVAAVSALCRTYCGQLEAHGFDVDVLPRVEGVDRKANYQAFKERAAETAKADARAAYAASHGTAADRAALREACATEYVAWIDGQDMIFQTPYDVDFTAAVKALNGRRWDGGRRVWVVALRANAAALLALLDKFAVACPADARALLVAHAADHAAATVEAAQRPHVTLEGGEIVLRTPYNKIATEVIKALQGRRWDADAKVWRVAGGNAAAVATLAKRFNWRVAPEVVALAARVRGNVAASRATDADVALTGLRTGITPYPFQRAGIAYAVANKNVLITDSTGLGKTPQAMIAVEQLGAYPALVVCPKAVKRQWRREVEKFLVGRTSSEVNGKVDLSGDFVVVNYAQLGKLTEVLKVVKGGKEGLTYRPTAEVAARGFRAIIVDESQSIKDAKALQSKRVKALARLSGLQCRLLLTATPIMNRPIELMHQLDVLGRLNEFGGFWAFAKRYCDATEGRYGWDLSGASNLEELNIKLRATCMVRREKADVVKELPALQRTVVPCEITDKHAFAAAVADVYEWLRQARQELPPGQFQAEALVRINALRQLAGQYKLPAALEWITTWLDGAEGEKMVVFAHHREIQGKLLAGLAAYGAVAISGEHTDAQRAAAVETFWHDAKCRVIVCSLKAASVGLNLQCAGTVAFCEFGWHAADMDQAEGRVHRIGSEAEAINAYWLAGEGTFDQDMIELIEAKRAIAQAAIVGEGEGVATDIVTWFAGLAGRFSNKGSR